MSFVELHQPCPDCGSSDALSVNDDGSAFCFSCGQWFSRSRYESITGTTFKQMGDIQINVVQNEPLTFAEE